MRLIDADALIKTFFNHSCTEFEIKNMCRTNEHVIALIDNAPTISPFKPMCKAKDEAICEEMTIDGHCNCIEPCPNKEERPQGEWKVYGRQGGIPISDYCTNCKYEMKWYRNKYNFCPNCGADMRGKDNG